MGYSESLKVSFPIIHCLMNSKKEESYKQMFRDFDDIIQGMFDIKDLNLDPTVMTTDFELALINSSKWNYPKATHLGCFVHFLRSQINKLKSLGFATKENKKVKYNVLTLISTLPFMQIKSIRATFDLIRSMFPDLKDYFEYFKNTWLDGQFLVKDWNILTKLSISPALAENLKHSNNQVETFHSVLNYLLMKSTKPELGELIDALKYIEARTTSDLNEYENGHLIPVRFSIICYF